MKKINFLKKLTIGLAVVFGVGATATSCNAAGSTSTDGTNIIIKESSTFGIKKESGASGENEKYWLEFTIAVKNNTIYDTSSATVQYKIAYTDEAGKDQEYLTEEFKEETFRIKHGVQGYLYGKYDITNELKPDEIKAVKKIELVKTNVVFKNVWETYIHVFIVAIVIVSISLIFYCITIFRKGLSTADVKEILRAHIGQSLVTLLFVLIICLIPLMFSSWMVSIILLGSFIVDFLLCFILTVIKSAASKDKAPKNIQ